MTRLLMSAAVLVMAACALPACGSATLQTPAGIAVMKVGGELLSDGVADVPPQIDFTLHANPEPVSGVTVQLDALPLKVEYQGNVIAARAPHGLAYGSAHILTVHLPGIGTEHYHISIVSLTRCLAAWFRNAEGRNTVDLSFSGAPVQAALREDLPQGSITWRSATEVVLHPNASPVSLRIPASLPTAHGAHLAAALVLTLSTWPTLPGLSWDPALPALPSMMLTAFSDGGSGALSALQHYGKAIGILDPVGLTLAGNGAIAGNPSDTGGALAQHMDIMPVIQNAFTDPTGINTLLGSAAREEQFIQQARARVLQYGAAGVNIDFENMPSSLRTAFTGFIGQLAASLHGVGKTVSVDIPVSTPGSPNSGYDDAALSHEADAVIIMAYDESTSPGAPGPVAGSAWVAETLSGMLPGMQLSHVVLGIPLYGRVWDGAGVHSCQAPACEAEALSLPGAFVGEDFADPSVLVSATDAAGNAVTAAVSTQETVTSGVLAAERDHLAGVAVWRLGEELPGIALP